MKRRLRFFQHAKKKNILQKNPPGANYKLAEKEL
jgi:hypothetical protein